MRTGGGSQHLKGQVMTNKINVSPISRLVHWLRLCSHTHSRHKKTHIHASLIAFSLRSGSIWGPGEGVCHARTSPLSFSLLSHTTEAKLYFKVQSTVTFLSILAYSLQKSDLVQLLIEVLNIRVCKRNQ